MDATTQEGVAGMSDAEMLNSLTAMFDAEMLPNDPKEGEPAEEVEPTVEAVEAVDDGDTSEDTEAEQDTEIEAQAEQETEGEEPSDGEKWTPNSLDDLAEALEMAPDQVAETMKLKVKVDGVEGEATLKDVIKSYQLERTLHERLSAQAEERKAFEAQLTQLNTTLNERLEEASSTVEAVEMLMAEEYQSVDWEDLKESDPTEYMLKQQEIRDKYSRVQQRKAEIAQARAEDQKKQQEEVQTRYRDYLNQQKQLLLEKVPEWSDEKQLKTDLAAVQDYMRSMGATDAEISQIRDHRVFLMALKAMRYDQVNAKAEPKMKQMKSKPKFVKPGVRKDPATVSEKRKKDAFKRAQSANTDDAWAEALLASGKL